MLNKDRIFIGDCKDVLKDIDSDSIDCIITDPPYGLDFMGMNWDKALPSEEALRECCRVLKPGAFGFFMCTPRQDLLSRMIIRLEDCGFMTGFTSIFWCYAQGFPKAADMSKLVDKRLGAEREVIGKGKYFEKQPNGLQGATVTGFKDCIGERYGSNGYTTSPATPEARALNGAYAGFSPKPAVEPIVCVMKPLSEKTYVDQALKNGKGVTWLGDCKIPIESVDSIHAKNPHTHRENNRAYSEIYGEYGASDYKVPDGRFPANVLCSDDVLNDGTITKSNSSGKVDPLRFKKYKEQDGNERHTFCTQKYNQIHDSGTFSRYFDLDAWFTQRVQQLPEAVQKTYPYLIVPKPSKSEKNKYAENKHPTVKPVKLMSYLVTLGSRENDIILDPYAGSGTTLEACNLLNRRFIGIDLEESNRHLMEFRTKVPVQFSLENFSE